MTWFSHSKEKELLVHSGCQMSMFASSGLPASVTEASLPCAHLFRTVVDAKGAEYKMAHVFLTDGFSKKPRGDFCCMSGANGVGQPLQSPPRDFMDLMTYNGVSEG